MNRARREILKLLGAGIPLAGLPSWVWAHCRQAIMPWRNWSGAQSCIPARRLAPADEDELAAVLKAATGRVRPVGSGHSFSPLVPTGDTLLSVGRLQGLIDADPVARRATFGGGTLLSRTGEPLEKAGLALTNMPDVDYQTLGGLYATSTHGTGARFGSLSTQVTGLRLVTPEGEILDCDAHNHPEVFQAARTSLGALGVASRFTIQCRDAFRLRERQWIAPTEDLLDDVDRLVAENRHFEMLALTHSDYTLAVTLNEAGDLEGAEGVSGEDAPPPSVEQAPGEDAPARPAASSPGASPATAQPGASSPETSSATAYLRLVQKLDQYGRDVPAARRAILNFIAAWVGPEERVGASHRIFANVRNVRFNEMEYAIPAEAGPDCLREILRTIEEKRLWTWFPIEYRYIAGDDIWLSQFHGRDSVAISIHQHYTMGYHDYFSEIEPIFWKYEGRPHWGKLHNLGASVLKDKYPHWKDFLAVREALDPRGKLLNGHLQYVFGL